MDGERNISHGKRVKIVTCRKSSAISAYLPLLLLLLQLPASSCYDLTDFSLCHVRTKTVEIGDEEPIFIRPHRNTTTLTLSSYLCDFSLTLNFFKEELITDHLEDVDGNLWGPLMYTLAPESINITLIGKETVYPINSSSCITRNKIKVKFNTFSVVDVAFLKLLCVDDWNSNTNINTQSTWRPTSSTIRIPMKLIFLPILGVIAIVAACVRMCKKKGAPQNNSSTPIALPLNGVNNTGAGVSNSSGPVPPYYSMSPVPPYPSGPVPPYSMSPVPNSNAPVPLYPSGPVPNSNAPVPPYSSGPVPNSNAPVPPYPSGPVPPYSMTPSNTSPSTNGSNPAYINDNTKF